MIVYEYIYEFHRKENRLTHYLVEIKLDEMSRKKAIINLLSVMTLTHSTPYNPYRVDYRFYSIRKLPKSQEKKLETYLIKEYKKRFPLYR